MNKKYYLVVILAAFLYAMYLIVNRVYLIEGLSSLNFACGSSIFAAIFALVFLITSKRIQEVRRLNKRSLVYILTLGLIMGVFFRVILFFGQSLVAATNTGFLLRVAPLFALLFGYLFIRETITKKHILLMLVMIFGVYLLATGGKFVFEFGDLILVFAGLLIGFDHAFSRKIMKKGVSPDILTALEMIIGAIVLFLFIMIFSSFSFIGWEIYLLSGLLLFFSVFIRNLGLKHIKASIVSSILLLSPIFTAVVGMSLLHEKLTLFQLLGGFIILIGGYFIIRIKS